MNPRANLLAAMFLLLASSVSAFAFTPVASLEPNFGNAGLLVLPPSISAALQPDGKLLVLGSDADTLVVSRYTQAGALDTAFGLNGFARLTVNGSALSRAGAGNGILVAPDGGFYVPGAATDPCKVDAACSAFVIGHFLRDGQLDGSFGTAGYAALAVSQLNPPQGALMYLALDPNGAIVVAENAYFPGNLVIPVRVQSMLERLSSRGARLGSWAMASTCGTGIDDVSVQGDGGIVITIQPVAGGEAAGMCLSCYSRDGVLDTTFGSGGIARFGKGTVLTKMYSAGTLLTADGSIVAGAVGSYPTPDVTFGTLTGFISTGQQNAAFGVPNGSGIAQANAGALAQSCGGKIVGAIVSSAGLANPAVTLTRYSSNAALDTTFSGTPDGAIVTPVRVVDGLLRVLVRPDGTIVVVGTGRAGDATTANRMSFALAYGQTDCHRPQDTGLQTVVEYYNAEQDHYFMTAAVADMAALDSGRFVGWQRTGYTFASTPTLTNPVCRFYIPPGYGDSHFFSASPVECGEVQTKFPQFVYETGDAMRANVPDIITGACAAPAAVPVYRVWDKRIDTNHRYMTSREMRDAMVANGWLPEGYGSDAVAMCVVPQ